MLRVGTLAAKMGKSSQVTEELPEKPDISSQPCSHTGALFQGLVCAMVSQIIMEMAGRDPQPFIPLSALEERISLRPNSRTIKAKQR